MKTTDEPVENRRMMGTMLGWRGVPLPLLTTLLLVGALIPVAIRNDYLVNLLILMFLYATLNQSWNLTLGMCGIWQFAQLALFALGGYASGIAATRLGIPMVLAVFVGGAAAVIANAIIMVPTMRVRGIYAGLLTFSFAEIFRLAVYNDNSGLTGGAFGLSGIPGLFGPLSPRAEQLAYYWLTLALCVGTALLLRRVMHSPFGMALQSLKDSTRSAIGVGVNNRTHVLYATSLSALLAGVAGAIYGAYYSAMSPSVMGLTPMSLSVLMIVVGGLGTISGPIVGTFVVMGLTEALRQTGEWRVIALCTILLLVLAFQPGGLTTMVSRLNKKVGAWVDAGTTR